MTTTLAEMIDAQRLRPGISDIHIHVGRAMAVRVDGDIEMCPDCVVDQAAFDGFFQTYLSAEQRARFESHGDVDLAIVINDQRYRASVAKGSRGHVVVLRLLATKIPQLEDLNLPPVLHTVSDIASGLVLVTGPTGSGKSTSLAALVNKINAEKPAHILTIEDPIEFVHENQRSLVLQREVGRDAPSFAQALRAALREDPDVVLVGELRDLETVSLALTAAETGHLVLATLHTNGAPSTINRIIDTFPAEQQGQVRAQLAQTLRVVMTQRLYKRAGGSGRVGAYEVMVCNNAVKNLIREGKIHQIESVMQTARGDGMQTMESHVQQLRASGLIAAGMD